MQLFASYAKKLITPIAIVGLFLAYSPLAKAFPFRKDPESFTAYMNTRQWRDGSKVTFMNLHGCKDVSVQELRRFNIDLPPFYFCSGGFVRIQNPMGSKVYSLGKDVIYYSKTDKEEARWSYSSSNNCRYQ